MSEEINIQDHEANIIEGTGKYSHWEIDNKLDDIENSDLTAIEARLDAVEDYTHITYLCITSPILSSSSTSYTQVAKFIWNDFLYPDATGIYLRTNLYSDNVSYTASVKVRNLTNAVDIAGTELTTTSTDADHLEESADIKGNFPGSQKLYGVRIKISNGSGLVSLGNMILEVRYKIT